MVTRYAFLYVKCKSLMYGSNMPTEVNLCINSKVIYLTLQGNGDRIFLLLQQATQQLTTSPFPEQLPEFSPPHYLLEPHIVKIHLKFLLLT